VATLSAQSVLTASPLMQRWTAFLFIAFVAGAVALVVVGARGGRAAGPQGGAPVDAGAPAPSGAAAAPTDAGATQVASTAPSTEPAGPGDPPPPSQSDAGATLITGEPAPALSANAPKSVVFGVILVQYKGAQGAAPNARSRDAALALAKQLAADAKQDFKAAVAKGDKGSTENVGKIQRNFLEPAPEYVLFSLAKDGVSDPVDTPRGFWIVKRIE
jgi:hypothetical protein